MRFFWYILIPLFLSCLASLEATQIYHFICSKEEVFQLSKTLKLLWKTLFPKFSMDLYVIIKSFNCWKYSCFVCYLSYLSKNRLHPIPNLKGFQYQVWTSERLEKKLSSMTSFSIFLHISCSNCRLNRC